mgnify:CR=1 FL=1
MKKNFTRIIVAVIAAALLYVGVSYLTKPPVEQGSKEVTLIMSTKLEGEVNEVFKKTFKTDAEMLGDLSDTEAIDPLRNTKFGNPKLQDEVTRAIAKIHERCYTRECPFCAEIIKKQATICKHCKMTVAGE